MCRQGARLGHEADLGSGMRRTSLQEYGPCLACRLRNKDYRHLRSPNGGKDYKATQQAFLSLLHAGCCDIHDCTDICTRFLTDRAEISPKSLEFLRSPAKSVTNLNTQVTFWLVTREKIARRITDDRLPLFLTVFLNMHLLACTMGPAHAVGCRSNPHDRDSLASDRSCQLSLQCRFFNGTVTHRIGPVYLPIR